MTGETFTEPITWYWQHLHYKLDHDHVSPPALCGPNVASLLRGRRVLVVDDRISSRRTALAALSVLNKIGADPVGLAFAMSQSGAGRGSLNERQNGLVTFVFQTPHFVRDQGAEGWLVA